MAMKRIRRSGQLQLVTEISTTSLLDLVFLLLFSFMVAVPLMRWHAHQADSFVPESGATSNPVEVQTLTVRTDGMLDWQGTILTMDELEARAKNELSRQPSLGVVVRIGSGQPVSALIGPMQALLRAGVRNTSVDVVEEGGGG